MNISAVSTPMRASAPPAQPAPTPAPPDTTAPAPPADPFLHQLITLKNAADVANFSGALEAEVKQTVGSMVTGWSTPHVEKPSFPGTVHKAAAKYAPIAAAQVAQNQAGVLGLLANPSVDNALLIGAETRLDPKATPVNHDLADPDFRAFYNAMRGSAGNRGLYEYEGTLVNVGWGSGDHVNATSRHLPVGPNTLSTRLANSTAQGLTATK